jgi:hypothetical protein
VPLPIVTGSVLTMSRGRSVHSYCLVTMRKIMKDRSSSMFPLTNEECKMSHPLFKKYQSGSCDESCWKATVDNMKTATGGAEGKFRCCALLYYDKMTQYTYFNGKPEPEKDDFNTLTLATDEEVKKGANCEAVPCTTFPEVRSSSDSPRPTPSDLMPMSAHWCRIVWRLTPSRTSP